MGLKPPHILLASTNSLKMLENVRHILNEEACDAIQCEINEIVKSLFSLGEIHYNFAKHIPREHWRQRISRFYYGAYNISRAIRLQYDGVYKKDISDHENIGKLPDGFPNREMYERQLKDLREDRNLADYDHTGIESDLILTMDESENLVTEFISDARNYMSKRGLQI